MSSAGFQPFLISEFKTGIYNYLQPWIRPIEAFEPLENGFVYRGNVQKRKGYIEYGRLAYCDNVSIETGNGTPNALFTGTLGKHPITPGTFTPTISTSGGIETFTDDGLGTITGTIGMAPNKDTGTINYTSGAWTIQMAGGRSILNTTPVMGHFSYIPTLLSSPIKNPIMGLKEWESDTSTIKKLLGMDTKRASVWNDSTQMFDPLCMYNAIIWVGDNTTLTITLATGFAAVSPYTQGIAPLSISITDGTSTIVDDGVGNLSASGNFAAGGTVSYANGTVSLVFTAPTTATITMTANLTGDYFTGDLSNFFNSTNWIAPSYYAFNPGFLYFVNGVDRITAYNGGTLSRPPFPIINVNKISFTNDITSCLDVDVYKNRFLVQRPILVGSSTPNGQSIRFSALNQPTNLVADVTGNGGELSAPTNDFIMSTEFLRDELVVLMANSTWLFRFTGSAFEPFRFDKINNTKSTNAPYGTVAYDERVTAMGNKGLIACDGVNVQRYDIQIIDEFTKIEQSLFNLCYSLKFDTINQTWSLFPSSQESVHSDMILVYNFLENSWSTYDIPLSCLGIHFIDSDVEWKDFAVGQPLAASWNQLAEEDDTWDSYAFQESAPILLGGGHTGIVYKMDQGETDHPDDVTIPPALINYEQQSVQWNPFKELGQKVQFGYIDIYYEVNAAAELLVTFFLDNSEASATNRTLTLDTKNVSNTKEIKRIYINATGEFLKMDISGTVQGGITFLGMVLWARPAGRFTP